jgi:hypothetical protein
MAHIGEWAGEFAEVLGVVVKPAACLGQLMGKRQLELRAVQLEFNRWVAVSDECASQAA